MNKGLDADCVLTDHAGQLVADGYGWVGRYLKPLMIEKTLTLPEAQHLSKMGLFIVSIVEMGKPTSADYFTADRGASVARTAYVYAHGTLGQPGGSTLYFTVDGDLNIWEVMDFFRSVKSTLQACAADGGPVYELGVYGSGSICLALLNAGLVTKTWLAQSTGWRGYQAFKASGCANIMQSAVESVHGFDCDGDISNGNAGGWRI